MYYIMKQFYENISKKKKTISEYEYEETFRNNFIFTSKISIIKNYQI